MQAMNLHHVAVQTADLENSTRWYRDFFEGCKLNWELDEFSELTRSRLPGIQRMVELQVGTLRFHVTERSDVQAADGDPPTALFQHCGLLVSDIDDLARLRARWIALYESSDYAFARPDPPSEVVFDADGVGSLYVLDPNGLEFEFTYVPPDSER
jgi:catechol 2,3-dioxygenase-like lactoylglutathione lyase family enzyme